MEPDGTYFEIRVEPHWVYVCRTRTAYPSTDVARVQLRRMAQALDPHRSSRGLLFDLRQARGRNDPEFEAQTRGLRGKLVQGFRRAVCLVGTMAGKLQVKRHMVEDGAPDVLVTTSIEEARAFLRS